MNQARVEEVPGQHGLPVLGVLRDTAEFLQGWRAYFERRQAQHQTTVFRTDALMPAVTVLDQKSFAVLMDPSQVAKEYGFGRFVPRRRFLGVVPTSFMNVPEHVPQKDFVLTLMHEAMPRFLPVFEGLAEKHFERWEKAGAFDWGADTDTLVAEFLFEWLLGTPVKTADLYHWASNIISIMPVDLPKPSDLRMYATTKRMLEVIRQAPRFPAVAELARRLVGHDEDATARHLLYFLGVNAFGGIQSLLRSLIAELTNQPEARQVVVDEVQRVLGTRSAGLAELGRLEALDRFVAETLRLHPPVTFIYGRARQDLVLESHAAAYRIRQGELLQSLFPFLLRDPQVFANPDAFDPDRFRDPAARVAHVWANGPGAGHPDKHNKMCAGKDIAPLIAMLFGARLLQSWEWTLRETPVWNSVRMEPGARPKTPIVATSFRRAAQRQAA